MMKRRSRSRGFSLIEILTVLGIIGVLSLVTVPLFINYQRRNFVRTALREFTTTLRRARMDAISGARSGFITRVQMVGDREYQTFQSTDNGATWTGYNIRAKHDPYNRNWLPQTMRFTTVTFTDKAIDFRWDGTVDETGTVVMKTDWADIINEVTVEVSLAGQVKSSEKKAP